MKTFLLSFFTASLALFQGVEAVPLPAGVPSSVEISFKSRCLSDHEAITAFVTDSVGDELINVRADLYLSTTPVPTIPPIGVPAPAHDFCITDKHGRCTVVVTPPNGDDTLQYTYFWRVAAPVAGGYIFSDEVEGVLHFVSNTVCPPTIEISNRISNAVYCGGEQIIASLSDQGGAGIPNQLVHLYLSANGGPSVDTGISCVTSPVPSPVTPHLGECVVDVQRPAGPGPFIYKWLVVYNSVTYLSADDNINFPSGGACGDPQFYGFNGQSFQVHGTSGSVYNIISSPSLQYNALFTYLQSGACRKGTPCFSHPGNYFGEVGLMLAAGEQVKRFRMIAGPVDAGMSVFVDDVELSVSSNPIIVGNATVSFPDRFEVLVDTPEYNMRIQNSDYFLNQDISIASGLAKKIVEFKKAAKNGVESSVSLPHGILGQTWNTAVYNNRWKHIEGQLFSYLLTDGIFGTEFAYNQFNH